MPKFSEGNANGNASISEEKSVQDWFFFFLFLNTVPGTSHTKFCWYSMIDLGATSWSASYMSRAAVPDSVQGDLSLSHLKSMKQGAQPVEGDHWSFMNQQPFLQSARAQPSWWISPQQSRERTGTDHSTAAIQRLFCRDLSKFRCRMGCTYRPEKVPDQQKKSSCFIKQQTKPTCWQPCASGPVADRKQWSSHSSKINKFNNTTDASPKTDSMLPPVSAQTLGRGVKRRLGRAFQSLHLEID